MFSDLLSSTGKLATRVDRSAILMKKFSRLILFVLYYPFPSQNDQNFSKFRRGLDNVDKIFELFVSKFIFLSIII